MSPVRRATSRVIWVAIKSELLDVQVGVEQLSHRGQFHQRVFDQSAGTTGLNPALPRLPIGSIRLKLMPPAFDEFNRSANKA